MRVVRSRLFCPLLAAYFGLVSLCGQSLHLLVDHGDACPAAHSACDHGPGASHRQHHATHCCADDNGAADHHDGGDHVGPAWQAAGHDPHDCPICVFFAQSQWAVTDTPACLETTVSLVAPRAAPHRLPVFASVYRGRAPPAAARLS